MHGTIRVLERPKNYCKLERNELWIEGNAELLMLIFMLISQSQFIAFFRNTEGLKCSEHTCVYASEQNIFLWI